MQPRYHGGGALLATAAMLAAAQLWTGPGASALAPLGPGEDMGLWEEVKGVPFGAIHSALLPDGKVLLYAVGKSTTIWDPGSRSFVGNATSHTNVFCSGMALLADGRLLATGGTLRIPPDPLKGFEGIASAETFDAEQGAWTQVADMAGGPRWYPTAVTLATGEVAVFAGAIYTGVPGNPGPHNPKVEVYQPDTGNWTLRGERPLPMYVRAHLMPNGTVFLGSPQARSAWWSPLTGDFFEGPLRAGGTRDGGASVLLDAVRGDVLVFGGRGGADAPWTSELYSGSDGSWTSVASMAYPRVWPDAVLLPTGDVLAIGGEVGEADPDALETLDGPVAPPRAVRGGLRRRSGDLGARGHAALLPRVPQQRAPAARRQRDGDGPQRHHGGVQALVLQRDAARARECPAGHRVRPALPRRDAGLGEHPPRGAPAPRQRDPLPEHRPAPRAPAHRAPARGPGR